MSHTAIHQALGSKSEIQNALESEPDYTYLIGKTEEPRKENKKKENNFCRKKGRNQKQTKKLLKLL